jgi:hypothetical protein
MNATADVQTPVPEKKDKLHRVLIAMIVALVVFIVVSVSLTVFIIVRQGPAEPKPMVLRHPSDETVPAGVTQDDLEQAMQLTKQWVSDSVKGAFRGGTPQDAAEGIYPLQEMLADGRIVSIPNGTRCLLTDSGWKVCRVQMTEGPLDGQRYWVYRNCLSRLGDTEVPAGCFFGFMCASVYLRYLITAALCCAGIYALKLQSVFMQIVLFIIGMVVLNLLWARLAMLLMF